MRVLLINDSTSNPNWGDRAAAISLRAMTSGVGASITDAISEQDLGDASFFEPAVGNPDREDPSAARRVATLLLPPVLPKLKSRALRRVAGGDARRAVPTQWAGFEPRVRSLMRSGRPWPRLLQVLDGIDVAVIHGDGCMVGNGIVPRAELFLAYLIKKHLGKHVIIVNHSADFDDPALREIAENVYPLFDDVVFREPVSAEKCKTLCSGRYAPDTAFWFKPAPAESWAPLAGRLTYMDVWPDTARFDPSAPYVCIGGSSVFGLHMRRRAAIGKEYLLLIEHLRSVYSGQLVLTVSDAVDQAVLRPVAHHLSLPLVGLTTPVQQVVDLLGNADAYIGGRWHPSIFSLRGGAPVLALSSKTFKMQALTDAAGLPEATFDALRLVDAAEAIGRRLTSYLELGDDLRETLAAWAERCAKASWGNVGYLKSMFTCPNSEERPIRGSSAEGAFEG